MLQLSTNEIAKNLVNRLNNYAAKSEIDYIKMVYGLEIMLHNIPKLVIIVLFSFLLETFPYTLMTLATFAIIRRYAAGLHASNGYSCMFISLIIFVGVPYYLVTTNFVVNMQVFIIIFSLVTLVMFKYSPADTEARPIIGKKKRTQLKIKSVLSCVLIFILALALQSEVVYVMVSLGAIYACVAVLPATYILLNRRRKNYEQYE